MRTVELTLYVEEPLQEWLIAFLEDLDFDAFLQEDHRLKAYLPAARWNDVARERIEQWLLAHGLDVPIEEQLIEPQDWNAQWERSLRPVAVGPFLIRPTWTETPPEHADKIVLEIDPKMSFGTGYHESTRLVLRVLPSLIRGGERVLDAGTGTGILAIAAVRLGAAGALAFDIDPWAAENAAENFARNGVADRIAFREGSLEVVPESGFDLVLANINRNVLLDLLPGFAEKTRPGGRIVLAGLLTSDRDRMLEAAARMERATRPALTPLHEATEGEWWSVVLERPA
ncbi:50S ribosomal protein L11 methyltransferase [Rhodocaloribacter litoris]|uniref:50S ribosomal protein L11 methyltransferase n=1 Tax=Rhodocaloribacter litoris TaxID=2558931 RepID=UPI00141E7B94|nr:50S ribosomal protein L11 methyltransferase [Rhodocaloribacter litoris]QXD16696.1 50S ribosomal protein L11 methyltransferase [Rhodocaloribacter litoris]